MSNKEKGIKRKVSWFLQLITLGDGFLGVISMTKIKKGIVDFSIVFL